MDLTKCSNCSEEVTEDSDFCPHCGILFLDDGEVLCDAYPQNRAKGVCIICRKLVCEECGVVVRERIFCQSHSKVKVEQDWAEVFRSTEIADAELVKSVLESVGRKVLVQNFNSIGFIWDGGGDSPISRSNINKPARVFVPIPEYIEAMGVINGWHSSQAYIQPDGTEPEI